MTQKPTHLEVCVRRGGAAPEALRSPLAELHHHGARPHDPDHVPHLLRALRAHVGGAHQEDFGAGVDAAQKSRRLAQDLAAAAAAAAAESVLLLLGLLGVQGRRPLGGLRLPKGVAAPGLREGAAGLTRDVKTCRS